MFNSKSRILILFLFLSGISHAEVNVLLDENFDAEIKKPGLGIGAQGGGVVSVSTDPLEVFGGKGGSLRAIYPKANGGIYGWASFDMRPYGVHEVYIEFHAKMPKAKQGLKFLKVFGKRESAPLGTANTTFGLDYTGASAGKGSMYQVSFGDGRTTTNDTQNVINFDGTHPEWIGRSYGTAVVRTPEKKAFAAVEWGNGWHHFKFKVKFNSVIKNTDDTYTEINDGEYLVQIDGKVYVDATGLLNRHPSNGPIDKVALLDWSQAIDEPFEIWYDNVKITTGGFQNDQRPEAPEAKLH